MRLITSSFAALALAAATASAAPIVEFKFETNASTGTNTVGIRYVKPANDVSDPKQSAAGLGLTGDLVGSAGFGIDRAFQMTGKTATASDDLGEGRVETANAAGNGPADVQELDNLTSFTVSLWHKAEELVGGRFATDNAFEIIAGSTGKSGGKFTAASDLSTAGYTDKDKWYFYAATFDGASIKYYKGYRNNTEAAVGTNAPSGLANVFLVGSQTFTSSLSPGGNADNPLVIGNRQDNLRGIDGYIDNFRIDGTALSLTDLETRRAADVAVVPEPAAAGLLGLASLAALGRRRRAC